LSANSEFKVMGGVHNISETPRICIMDQRKADIIFIKIRVRVSIPTLTSNDTASISVHHGKDMLSTKCYLMCNMSKLYK